jgi:WD40 repeat protein
MKRSPGSQASVLSKRNLYRYSTQWIVCGSDDMFVRVYNYNTTELVKAFEAHTDYIRCVSVHPTMPYILTCSDDMLIKLWDWDKVGLGIMELGYGAGSRGRVKLHPVDPSLETALVSSHSLKPAWFQNHSLKPAWFQTLKPIT